MSLKNSTFYNSAYKKHGISARGLNWNSEQSQKIRFEVICEFLANEFFTCKVVDAGCGFGDLYLYMEENNFVPKEYIGIDCMQNSIQIAQKRYPKVCFTCKDILKDDLPYSDWYIASGSLNILGSFDTWYFLERMLLHCEKGIVFNILEGNKQNENFNYQQKEDIINFAKKKGLKIRLRNDYLANDITVELRK